MSKVLEAEKISTLKMENLKLRAENERLRDIIVGIKEELSKVQVLKEDKHNDKNKIQR